MTLEQRYVESHNEGFIEGKAEGRAEATKEIALNLLSTHSNEEIARICNITVEEVKQLREQKFSRDTRDTPPYVSLKQHTSC